MNKLLMIFGVIILFVCTGFSGCIELGITAESEEDKFIGSWSTGSVYDFMTLLSSGRLRKFRYDGTWNVDEDKLILSYGAGSNSYDHTYYYSFTNYSLSNYTLVLVNVDTDNSLTYTKQ